MSCRGIQHLLASVLVCAASGFLLSAQEPHGRKKAPVKIREVFVPYEEFRAITSKDPDGIIMSLEEYRASH